MPKCAIKVSKNVKIVILRRDTSGFSRIARFLPRAKNMRFFGCFRNAKTRDTPCYFLTKIAQWQGCDMPAPNSFPRRPWRRSDSDRMSSTALGVGYQKGEHCRIFMIVIMIKIRFSFASLFGIQTEELTTWCIAVNHQNGHDHHAHSHNFSSTPCMAKIK